MGAHSAKHGASTRGTKRRTVSASPKPGGRRSARRAAVKPTNTGLRTRAVYLLPLLACTIAGWMLNEHVTGLLNLLPDWAGFTIDGIILLAILGILSIPRSLKLRAIGGILTVLAAPGFITHAFLNMGGDNMIAEVIFDIVLSVELFAFIAIGTFMIERHEENMEEE